MRKTDERTKYAQKGVQLSHARRNARRVTALAVLSRLSSVTTSLIALRLGLAEEIQEFESRQWL